MRSAAYGFTVGRMVANAYLPVSFTTGAPLTVEVLGEQRPAEVAADVLYDPENARVKT